mmetsp:Transcript_38135/g.89158  ORF Transcript_38135/g.89158 Transcript_38135/m.89158 type:complete len:235 (-) Transcript_38135:71-775(-)
MSRFRCSSSCFRLASVICFPLSMRCCSRSFSISFSFSALAARVLDSIASSLAFFSSGVSFGPAASAAASAAVCCGTSSGSSMSASSPCSASQLTACSSELLQNHSAFSERAFGKPISSTSVARTLASTSGAIMGTAGAGSPPSPLDVVASAGGAGVLPRALAKTASSSPASSVSMGSYRLAAPPVRSEKVAWPVRFVCRSCSSFDRHGLPQSPQTISTIFCVLSAKLICPVASA